MAGAAELKNLYLFLVKCKVDSSIFGLPQYPTLIIVLCEIMYKWKYKWFEIIRKEVSIMRRV